MKTFADHRAHHAAEIEDRLEARKQARESVDERRRTPMRERLRRVIKRIPDAEAGEPKAIDFFVEQLAPKYAGKRASPRDVARGLRELGWTRTRKWRSEAEGFRALWHPPTAPGGAPQRPHKTTHTQAHTQAPTQPAQSPEPGSDGLPPELRAFFC